MGRRLPRWRWSRCSSSRVFRRGAGADRRWRGRRPVRLLIADDRAVRSEWLRSVLQREPGIRGLDEARNGREAVGLCRSLEPNLVLMDVRMPEMDGLEATHATKHECPETDVLLVAMHETRTIA
jgi:two-component system, NarL family, response regulator LiaR